MLVKPAILAIDDDPLAPGVFAVGDVRSRLPAQVDAYLTAKTAAAESL
jgi:hypothetical protein